MSRTVKIFVASSGDLKIEREQCIQILAKINKSHIHLTLQPMLWELDLAGGNFLETGSIQEEINPTLIQSDFIIFIFHLKLGKFTEQEFKLAFTEKKKVFVFFKTSFPNNKIPVTNEFQQLQAFKESLKESTIHQDFKNVTEFKNCLLENVNLYLSQKYPVVKDFIENSELVNSLLKSLVEKDNKIEQIGKENEKELANAVKERDKLREQISSLVDVKRSQTAQLEYLEHEFQQEQHEDILKGKALNEIRKGQLKEVEYYLIRSLREHSETAKTFFEIGVLRDIQFEFAEAFKYYELAVLKDSETSLYLNAAGHTAYILGFYKKAMEFYRKAIAIEVKNQGPNCPTVAVFFDNLGAIANDTSQFDVAFNYYQKALEIRKNCYGNNHALIANSFNNIGGVFLSKGEIDEAIKYLLRAITLHKQVTNETISLTFMYNNLASAYQIKKDYLKALQNYQEALVICKEFFPDYHPQMATLLTNIARIYLITNDAELTKMAIEYLGEALAIDKRNYGDLHESVASSYYFLGEAYTQNKDYFNAIKNLVHALDVQRIISGSDDNKIVAICNSLGIALYLDKNYEYALACYQLAFNIRSRIYTDEEPVLDAISINIGQVYYALKDYRKALKNLKSAKSYFDEKFASSHPAYKEIDLTMQDCLFKIKERSVFFKISKFLNSFCSSLSKAFTRKEEI